jgi:predicted MFS family arabinose efflux permease
MSPVILSQRPNYILPLIVLSQFAGTSLWFAGNAVLPDLQQRFDLGPAALGNITSAVQLGFISGTLLFAVLSIADRFSPSKVFFVSSVFAAVSNLLLIFLASGGGSIMALRLLTGFFLAGIYPVGMKIAADWFEEGLGKALGYLVGALVLGTALPHLLKGISLHFSWQHIIIFTSCFATVGGLLIVLFVKDGPFRKQAQAFHPRNIAHIFRSPRFRSAAFGYFGHMWELYTLWAFVPVLLSINMIANEGQVNVSFFSFLIIGVGFLSCIAGGYIAKKSGSARVAFFSLLASGLCCFLSFFLLRSPFPYFIVFMLIWGITVVSDSPQFSALIAQTADPAYKGTALTIVTCIGFSITIVSIQFVNYLFQQTALGDKTFLILGIGPVLGLLSFYRSVKKK